MMTSQQTYYYSPIFFIGVVITVLGIGLMSTEFVVIDKYLTKHVDFLLFTVGMYLMNKGKKKYPSQ